MASDGAAARVMLNHGLRYERVVAFLSAHGAGSVLEVGSGSTGLAAFWPGSVTGLDMRFDGTPLDNLTAVVGSATQMPFGDRSFDAVVCTDVMEHLPPAVRADAMAEILRVAGRMAWVAFPSGDAATRADGRIARAAERLGRALPGWLIDHLELGFPTPETALGWPTPGFRREHSWSLPVSVHTGVVLLEHTPLGRLTDRLARSRLARRAVTAIPGRRHYRLEMRLLREG